MDRDTVEAATRKAMVAIKPRRIKGPWKDGYALDSYSRGHDDSKKGWATIHTEVGELVYKLKYKGDWSVFEELSNVAAQFLLSWGPDADLLIPAPSSHRWPNDPLLWLARHLGKTAGIETSDSCVIRVKKLPRLKTIKSFEERERLLKDAHRAAEVGLTRGKRILILDDLIESGSTLGSITRLLYSEGQAADVSVLALACH